MIKTGKQARETSPVFSADPGEGRGSVEIDTYNNNSHRSLDNKPLNQVFKSPLKDNDDQMARHIKDSLHNQQVYKTVPFDTGDKVRILEKKEKIDNGKQSF